MPVDPRAAYWSGIDPVALWSSVRAYVPTPPARVLEIGAGSGRDAAWFESLGYDVTSVEPDRGLWPSDADWVDSALPGLIGVDGYYDMITICAVWHLLPEVQWVASFDRLAGVSAPDGRLILSLRLPPVSDVDLVIASAYSAGWRISHRTRQLSQHAVNREARVMWDWCVFRRVAQD